MSMSASASGAIIVERAYEPVRKSSSVLNSDLTASRTLDCLVDIVDVCRSDMVSLAYNSSKPALMAFGIVLPAIALQRASAFSRSLIALWSNDPVFDGKGAANASFHPVVWSDVMIRA